MGGSHRGADRGEQNRARIRAPTARFHVRELITQRGDARRCQAGAHVLHEAMARARARAVREHQ
jgi:hypothetical protein